MNNPYYFDIWKEVANTGAQDKEYMNSHNNFVSMERANLKIPIENQSYTCKIDINKLGSDGYYLFQLDELYLKNDHAVKIGSISPLDLDKHQNNVIAIINFNNVPISYILLDIYTKYYRSHIWLNNFGIIVDNLDKLNNLSFILEINGSIIIKMSNILVDCILNNQIKYINNLYHVPLSYLFCSYKYPFPLSQTYWTNLVFKLNTSCTFYINYSYDNTNCDHRGFELMKPISVEQSQEFTINPNSIECKLYFNHPTHLIYFYFDDYNDYLDNVMINFNGHNICDSFDINKIKYQITEDNKFENSAINHYKHLHSAYNKIFKQLNVCSDIAKYLLPNYLINPKLSYHPLLNKTIYQIKFDKDFNDFGLEKPNSYINLSRIDICTLKIQHHCTNTYSQVNLNKSKDNVKLIIKCISKNQLKMINLMTGLQFSN
jgi:hypothetical protein